MASQIDVPYFSVINLTLSSLSKKQLSFCLMEQNGLCLSVRSLSDQALSAGCLATCTGRLWVVLNNFFSKMFKGGSQRGKCHWVSSWEMQHLYGSECSKQGICQIDTRQLCHSLQKGWISFTYAEVKLITIITHNDIILNFISLQFLYHSRVSAEWLSGPALAMECCPPAAVVKPAAADLKPSDFSTFLMFSIKSWV